MFLTNTMNPALSLTRLERGMRNSSAANTAPSIRSVHQQMIHYVLKMCRWQSAFAAQFSNGHKYRQVMLKSCNCNASLQCSWFYSQNYSHQEMNTSSSTTELNTLLPKSSNDSDNPENKEMKATPPIDIPIVALYCSPENADGNFWNRHSSNKFSCVLDLIASSERATLEDCQDQQEMMMQMRNHNQKIMMAILATLRNKHNNNNGDSNTQNNEKK